MKLDRRADRFFETTLSSGTCRIEGVPCYVYLPLKVADKIELHFRPTEEQVKNIFENRLIEFTVYGEETDGHRVRETLSIKRAFIRDSFQSTAHFGPYDFFTANPWDLRITHYWGRDSDDLFCTFRITPNVLLQQLPKKQRTIETHDGTKIEYYSEVILDDETQLELRHRRKTYQNKDRDTVVFYDFVASARFENAGEQEEKVEITLQKVDDLLLLASLAARNLTMCLDWEAYIGDAMIQQYLRDRAIPNEYELNRNGISPTIGFEHFAEFLTTTYQVFHNSAEHDVLRQVMYALIMIDHTTIEGGYIQLYTALEMLVLSYRRRTNNEFIFGEEMFPQIKGQIAEYIHVMDISNDHMNVDEISINKKRMSRNLGGLNRVSISEAFRSFSKAYSIYLKDLWPVHGGRNERSLNEIRNRLVHGELMDDSHYDALLCARQHLQWTVERMLFGVLQWPIEKSDISPDKLKSTSLRKEWRSHREVLRSSG